MKGAITIRDIANACGCSVTTVSFVLNNKCDNIGEETILKVRKAVKELGYAPSFSAASLKTKKSQVVGMLIPDIENDYYIKLIKRLEALLYEKNYGLLILSTNDSFEKELSAIDMFKRRGIDYLILVPGIESLKEENSKTYQKCLENLPFNHLILDRKITNFDSLEVLNDDILGGKIATEMLINNGYNKIACITGPHDVSSSIMRLEGYKQCLAKHNLDFDPSLIFEGNYRYESGKKIGEEILKHKDIDAVFAFNDLMAYGFYTTCINNNVSIGKDIQIIGYDDSNFSTLITPSLTTIRPDVDKISETIFKIIFDDAITTNKKGSYLIEPTLIIRKSVEVK